MSRKGWSILWCPERSIRPCAFLTRSLAALLVLTASGCGYQAVLDKNPPSYLVKESAEKSKRVHLSRMSIPVFANKTFEPLIEDTITRRFRQQVIMDGHLDLVSSRENSDIVLEGDVASLAQTPLSFDTLNNALEYRVAVTLRIALKDIRTGAVLWQKSGLTGSADYYVNADLSLNRAALDRAIDELSKVLAEDTLSDILNLYR